MSTSSIWNFQSADNIVCEKDGERIILTFSTRTDPLILQYLCNYVGFLVVIMVQKVL